jgi:transcriptional regulator with XRE-family HTH domain
MSEGLTPQHHRAVDLLARNWTAEKVADEIGVSEKTIQRWKQKEDFAELLRKRREALLNELPTAKATLEAALNATDEDGHPNWAIRVKAAQLLLQTADPEGDREGGEPSPTIIYMQPPEDSHADAD